jgi:L-ribulose-5-phosphate 3-epimerase
MPQLRIGVCLGSLALPLRRGLHEAERMGVRGVQVDAMGDLAPRALSQTGRREFLHLLRSHNLGLTALNCPLRHGLGTAEGQDARVDHVKRVLTLSFDLGPRTVIVQAGQVPEDPDAPAALLLSEALLALGQHGDRTGTILALETGLEPGETLRRFLDRFDTGGLGVNLDPANLLVSGFDSVESARALHGRIAHAHAKDARKSTASRAAQEVPLGHGDIDWLGYLSVLEEVGYHGWLVVERDGGDNRLADVAAGVQFLRRLGGETTND